MLGSQWELEGIVTGEAGDYRAVGGMRKKRCLLKDRNLYLGGAKGGSLAGNRTPGCGVESAEA